MPPPYAAFPEAEHRERLARARVRLRETGFDGCVAVAPEHLYYLAGYDSWVGVNSPQALVFGADGGEPTLVVRDVDLPLVRESSWIADVRTYRLHAESAAELVGNALREKLAGPGRIAVETQSYAVTHAYGQSLAAAIAPARMEDATDVLGELRVLKSPRELEYLAAAASHAAAGLAAAREHLRPGITEIALAGRIEAAMREAGSDYWSIPTELAGGPRSPGGHATPRERPIERGDLVHMEFAGVHRRYHAVAIHTMAAGTPNARARELYRLARRSLRAGIEAVRPGAPVSAIEEASLEPLRHEGLESAAMMRFGYGIGIAYPPIWLETLQISRGFDRRLEVGMVFVLHACLELPEEEIGIVQGGTYALTRSGLEMLVGGGDVGLEIAGS
jgi:Xaa-Pro aminopeptidase